jgi:hypothetical protein
MVLRKGFRRLSTQQYDRPSSRLLRAWAAFVVDLHEQVHDYVVQVHVGIQEHVELGALEADKFVRAYRDLTTEFEATHAVLDIGTLAHEHRPDAVVRLKEFYLLVGVRELGPLEADKFVQTYCEWTTDRWSNWEYMDCNGKSLHNVTLYGSGYKRWFYWSQDIILYNWQKSVIQTAYNASWWNASPS